MGEVRDTGGLSHQEIKVVLVAVLSQQGAGKDGWRVLECAALRHGETAPESF